MKPCSHVWQLAGTLSEAVSRTPTCGLSMWLGLSSQCCSWVPRMRLSLRDSHVSHIRGKCLTLYDLALEMMATWIFQGSTKAPPKFKVRRHRFYSGWKVARLEEEHLGPQITGISLRKYSLPQLLCHLPFLFILSPLFLHSIYLPLYNCPPCPFSVCHSFCLKNQVNLVSS